jgi:hypothetical protein
MSEHLEQLRNNLRNWRQLLYQEAQSDVRWAKERAWNVMYGALLVLAGLYVVGKDGANVEHPVPGLRLAVHTVVILASWWLTDLNKFAARARRYVEDVTSHPEFPPGSRYPRERPKDKDHDWLLLAHCFSVAIGGAIVWYSMTGVPNLCDLVFTAVALIIPVHLIVCRRRAEGRSAR